MIVYKSWWSNWLFSILNLWNDVLWHSCPIQWWYFAKYWPIQNVFSIGNSSMCLVKGFGNLTQCVFLDEIHYWKNPVFQRTVLEFAIAPLCNEWQTHRVGITEQSNLSVPFLCILSMVVSIIHTTVHTISK